MLFNGSEVRYDKNTRADFCSRIFFAPKLQEKFSFALVPIKGAWIRFLDLPCSKAITGLNTADDDVIAFVGDHFVGRCNERKISVNAVKDALTNPIRPCIIKTKQNGDVSKEYTGREARIFINPNTGKTVTAYPTSSDLRRKCGVSK